MDDEWMMTWGSTPICKHIGWEFIGYRLNMCTLYHLHHHGDRIGSKRMYATLCRDIIKTTKETRHTFSSCWSCERVPKVDLFLLEKLVKVGCGIHCHNASIPQRAGHEIGFFSPWKWDHGSHWPPKNKRLLVMVWWWWHWVNPVGDIPGFLRNPRGRWNSLFL